MLAQHGFSVSGLVYIDVSSPYNPDDTAYSNYIDGRSGVLICSENYKQKDRNPDGEKLYPSDILWQSWKSEAVRQRSRSSHLQVVVRLVVMNEETQRVIWQAAKLSTSTRTGPESRSFLIVLSSRRTHPTRIPKPPLSSSQ
jgi:hypothetical protein